MSTLGIYIQVPFCASKCTFCNFSSSVERSSIFDQYTGVLEREVQELQNDLTLRGASNKIHSLIVDSVYMGGGTPALLGADRLNLIVNKLRDNFRWGKQVEFTIETTPGSASSSLLLSFREMGINRLSIGAQTFDAQELAATGRLHSVEDTKELERSARQSGFRNISLDLIAGLPHQTQESFRRSLEETAKLRPEHVSLYLFEVDEKSRLGREVVHGGERYHAASVPSDDFMADAYETAGEFLAKAGYAQYEISNFALPGFESSHNRKYWRLEPYAGLGAGAHSFDGGRRWSNEVAVKSYISKLESGDSPVAELRTLSRQEQVEEFFFLGLRQVDGVDLGIAWRRWGTEYLKPWEEKIENLKRQGWVEWEGARVKLAPRAYLISNEIFQEFVSAQDLCEL